MTQEASNYRVAAQKLNALIKRAEELGFKLILAEQINSDLNPSRNLEEYGTGDFLVADEPEVAEDNTELENKLLTLISSLQGASIDVADLARQTLDGGNSVENRVLIGRILQSYIDHRIIQLKGTRYALTI